MSQTLCYAGLRQLDEGEVALVSGGFLAEVVADIGKTIIKNGFFYLVDKTAGFVQTTYTDANQTGVVGQPAYTDAMGNTGGVASPPAVESDNTLDY